MKSYLSGNNTEFIKRVRLVVHPSILTNDHKGQQHSSSSLGTYKHETSVTKKKTTANVTTSSKTKEKGVKEMTAEIKK